MKLISGNIRDCFVVGFICFSILVSGCSVGAQANMQTQDPQVTPTMAYTATTTATPFLALTNTPSIVPPTSTPTATPTPEPTSTPLPTDTPLPTNTPEVVWNSGGEVISPILLYHHVSDANVGNRYYITPEVFRAQLQALRDWGYTSITVSEMVDVLVDGGELPSRPVVITFDDGNLDIYQSAFPIMREMGFVGTFYIVGNRLQSKFYVDAEQIRELVNNGWEIGSHAMSHVDLTLDHSIVSYEVGQSKAVLEEVIGQPVNTFAFPYGETDEIVSNKVSESGYRAAMGLGTSWKHTWGTLFYLSRIEVQSNYDMAKFASLLPWSSR